MPPDHIAIRVAKARHPLLFALFICSVSLTATPSLAQICPPLCDPGTPDPGTPDPGTPDPGTPDPGTPDPGTPDPGTPDPGTPDPGTPDPGTPDPGTPDPGTPDPGTPDPGTPDPGVPESKPPEPPAVVTPSTGSEESTAITIVHTLKIEPVLTPTETVVKLLPPSLKSSAPRVLSLVLTGDLDLIQVDNAMNLYKAMTGNGLDSVEQQTLYELMFYQPTTLADGLGPLLLILPPDDPLRQKLEEYNVARGQATAVATTNLWAFKRAVSLGYAKKVADLSGLRADYLQNLCDAAFKDSDDAGHCRKALK